MKRTQISCFIACACLFLCLIFTSCEKEKDFIEEVPASVSFFEVRENNDEFGIGRNGDDIECFAFEYPISVKFPDGKIQTINSDEEMEKIIEEWFEANEEAEEEPHLIFPINVVLEDGSSLSLSKEEELCDLFEECYGDEEDWDDEDDWDEEEPWGWCFDIVYPITVEFPDNSTQVVNNQEEMEKAVEAWFDANPESDEDPMPQFPINVVLEDGTNKTIEKEEGLHALFEYCEGEEHEEEEEDMDGLCFDLLYPINLTFPDGTTATVNSDEEFEAACERWFEANPESNEGPEMVFPISISFEEETKVIEDDEAFDEALAYCEEEGDEWDCIELHFPVTMIFPDGTSVELANEEELEDKLEAYYDTNPNVEEEPSFDYPIKVTIKEDGSTMSVNSDEELEDLLEDC